MANDLKQKNSLRCPTASSNPCSPAHLVSGRLFTEPEIEVLDGGAAIHCRLGASY